MLLAIYSGNKKKKSNIILPFLSLVLLLSACNGNEDTNSNGTPAPQSSNANQTSSPNSPVYEINTMRINQDLTLKENAEDSVDSYPIYYENSKCVLENIAGKGRLKGDPWAKKQLKKNETYKAFGFDLVTAIRLDKYNARKPPYTRFTILFESETTELVYLWIDCFGNEAAQITSPSDLEKLLDNKFTFH